MPRVDPPPPHPCSRPPADTRASSCRVPLRLPSGPLSPPPLSSASPCLPRRESQPPADSVRCLLYPPDLPDQLPPSSAFLRFPPPTRGTSCSALRFVLT